MFEYFSLFPDFICFSGRFFLTMLLQCDECEVNFTIAEYTGHLSKSVCAGSSGADCPALLHIFCGKAGQLGPYDSVVTMPILRIKIPIRFVQNI